MPLRNRAKKEAETQVLSYIEVPELSRQLLLLLEHLHSHRAQKHFPGETSVGSDFLSGLKDQLYVPASSLSAQSHFTCSAWNRLPSVQL